MKPPRLPDFRVTREPARRGAGCLPTAPVERGPSEAARSARCATRGITSVTVAHAG